MEDFLLIALIGGLVTGFIGSYVAGEKGRSNLEGFVFGFLFSLLGVLIVGILPNKAKPVKKELTKEEIEKRKELAKKGDSSFTKMLIVVIVIFVIMVVLANVL